MNDAKKYILDRSHVQLRGNIVRHKACCLHSHQCQGMFTNLSGSRQTKKKQADYEKNQCNKYGALPDLNASNIFV